MNFSSLKARRTAFQFYSLLLLCHFVVTYAGLIPDANRVDWTPGVTVGVPGGIPTNRTHLINVALAPYNADRSGTVDSAPAIQAAIDAAVSNDVVYLPEGTYRIDSGLLVDPSRKHVTIRGSGEKTIIDSRAPSYAIKVGCDDNYLWSSPNLIITGGLHKGSSNLIVSSTSAFKIGQIIHIKQKDDTNLPVVNVMGSGYSRRLKSKAIAKTSTSLQIWPPLYFELKPELQPAISAASRQAEFVGIENMTITGINGTTTFLIYLRQAYGCWIKDVRTTMAKNHHLYISDSLQSEVRRCNLDQMQLPGLPNGSGLIMASSSGCLIEDNIIYKCFPLMEINSGCSGNAFAYNFCEDSMAGTQSGSAINSNHGPHNSVNLYEGNISPNLQADGYFGGVSHDVLFRNWFHGRQPGLSSPSFTIRLNRFTRNYAIVGNIIGCTNFTWTTDGESYGYPNMGNGFYSGTAQPSRGDYWKDWGTAPGPSGFQELDLDVNQSTVKKGNYNYAAHSIPPEESLNQEILTDSLLHKDSKPDWFGNFTWPPFDPTNPNPSLTAIPAGYRYFNHQKPADTIPPSRPVIESALSITNNQLRLTWKASTDNNSVAAYRIERSKGVSSTAFQQIGETPSTAYIDTSLNGSTNEQSFYTYRLRAVDSSGNLSSYSSSYTISVPTAVRSLKILPLE